MRVGFILKSKREYIFSKSLGNPIWGDSHREETSEQPMARESEKEAKRKSPEDRNMEHAGEVLIIKGQKPKCKARGILPMCRSFLWGSGWCPD